MVDNGNQGFKVVIFRINGDGLTVWSRETTRLSAYTETMPIGTNAWGAGWNFQNKVFFSHNGGQGVWQINMDDFDASDGNSLITAQRSGSSVPTYTNDGLNCMESAIPFTTCGSGGVEGAAITNADCAAIIGDGLVRIGSSESTCDVVPGQPCDLAGSDFNRCCVIPPPPAPTEIVTTTTTGLVLPDDKIDYYPGTSKSKSMSKSHTHSHKHSKKHKHGKKAGKSAKSMVSGNTMSTQSASAFGMVAGIAMVAGVSAMTVYRVRRDQGRRMLISATEITEETPLVEV